MDSVSFEEQVYPRALSGLELNGLGVVDESSHWVVLGIVINEALIPEDDGQA